VQSNDSEGGSSPTLKTDSVRSRVPDDAPDLFDLGAVVLGDLPNRHAVFYPAADAGKMRPRDLGRRVRLGRYRSFNFLVAFRWSGDCLQHPRLALGWRRWRAFGNGWFGDWWL